MKLLVNIECPLGLKTPNFYIPIITKALNVSDDNVWLCDDTDLSWYWILTDVDKNIYKAQSMNLQREFLNLTERGLVQYFYIGKAEINIQNAKLSSDVLETY